MKLTNKTGLPDLFLRAMQNDKYSPGGADFSVTGLLAPAYQKHLMRQHREEISEDVSDRLFALFGQSVHSILERSATEADIVEKRYSAYYQARGNHYRVSGQADLISGDTLYDFKVTTTYKAQGSPEWSAQVNMLLNLYERSELVENAALAQQTGIAVTGRKINKLAIIMFFRDWSRAEAMRNQDYPKSAIKVLPVIVWLPGEVEQFIHDRIYAHTEENPEPCSMEERWAVPGKFAVMKKGKERAIKLHDTKEGADKHAEELGKDHSVIERPARFPRCENYCSVSKFCPAWQAIQKGER